MTETESAPRTFQPQQIITFGSLRLRGLLIVPILVACSSTTTPTINPADTTVASTPVTSLAPTLIIIDQCQGVDLEPGDRYRDSEGRLIGDDAVATLAFVLGTNTPIDSIATVNYHDETLSVRVPADRKIQFSFGVDPGASYRWSLTVTTPDGSPSRSDAQGDLIIGSDNAPCSVASLQATSATTTI